MSNGCLRAVISASLLFATPALGKVRVVASVPDLAAIARSVWGARAEVTSLSSANQDPHFVDARPHLMLALNRADLLLTVGLQLEVGWLPVLLTGARNGRIQPGGAGFLDCSTVARLRQVPQRRIQRSMGDVHPGGNPHYLTDPGNAARVARELAKRLGELDPGGRASYQANADRFIAAVEQGWKRWRKLMMPYRGSAFVGFHNAWVYFAEAFGLKVVGYLEPKPGIPPDAAHLLRLIRRMRAQKVPLILCKTYYPDKATQLVARKTGATLVRVPGGADLGQGESYLQRIDRLVQRIAGALKARQAAGG